MELHSETRAPRDDEPDAFEYRRDDARRRITVVAQGDLTRDDFRTILDRQARERTWSYGLLYDLRRMTHALLPSDVDELACRVYRYLISHGPRGPVAVVTTAIDVIGSTRAYERGAARAGVDVQVFWNVADALPWIEAHQRMQP